MSAVVSAETVEVSGGRLHAERAGHGPATLFVHAAIADRRMWDREFREYAKDRTVLRYDIRGYGKSLPATQEFSDVSDVGRVLDHFGARTATIVGCSNGGRLAVDFALEHPGRVEKLLLVAPGISGFREEHDPSGKEDYARDGERLGPIFKAWKDGLHEEALGRLQEYWCSSQTGASAELVRTMMHENAQEIFTDRSSAHAKGIEPPAADRLKDVKVPTAVLYGDHDEATTRYMVRKLGRDLPNVTVVHVPEADHLVNLSRPREFDAAFRDLVG